MSMKLHKLISISIVILLPLSAAQADKLSLGDKQTIAKSIEKTAKRFDRAKAKFKKQCGADIDATIDWEAFIGHFPDAKGSPALTIANQCQDAVLATARLCKDFKDTIASSVKKIRCIYDASADIPTVKLVDGTMTVAHHMASKAAKKPVLKFLKENL